MAGSKAMAIRHSLLQHLNASLRRTRKALSRYSWLFLPIILFTYALASACYVLVWVVDPYELRPGGVPASLADRPYMDEYIPRLYPIAAKQDIDLMLVGGSTTSAVTTTMLQRAFPEAHRPYNLSFVGITENDLAVLLDRISTSTSLKRVLITIDFSLVRNMGANNGARTAKHYRTPLWHDPIPEFDLDAAEGMLGVVATGTLNFPGWTRDQATPPYFMVRVEPLKLRPEKIAKHEKDAVAGRSWVVSQPPLSCERIPALSRSIIPRIRQLAARGIKVDLIIPPYSLAVYTDWTMNFRPGQFFDGHGAVWASLIGLRKCLVEEVDNISGVSVHAFDTDLSITADLTRYLDSSHLYDPDAYQDLMTRVSKRSDVLTVSNWDAYARALEQAVLRYPQ